MSELAGVTNQFEWTTQEAAAYVYEMRDGVVRVFTDETRSEEPFVLPGTSFEFFSDMHRSAPPPHRQTSAVMETQCHLRAVTPFQSPALDLLNCLLEQGYRLISLLR